MKIGDKYALFIFLIYGVYAAVDVFVQYRVILPAFERRERIQASKSMDLVLNNIERDLVLLTKLGDSWQIEGVDVTSPPPQSLRSADVDFFALVDKDFDVIAQSPSFPEPLPPKDPVGVLYTSDQGLAHFLASWRSRTKEPRPGGLIQTSKGPALVVMQSIAGPPEEGSGERSLVLGRLLNNNVLADLGNRSQVSLRVEAPDRQQETYPGAAVPEPETVITSGSEQLLVSRTLLDPLDRPIVKLAFPASREITVQARFALRFAFFSLLLAGAVVVLAMMAVTNRMVVSPVQKIETFVKAIAGNDDLSPRLEIRTRDEFGGLASRINLMVDRLEKARREIVDQSFEAGLAEMARGVLHNIGNALTPVSVNATGLLSSARTLPSAEAAMANAELERDDLDPSRRADLERFLQMLGSSIAVRAGTLVKEAQQVESGLREIHLMLQEQSRFASTSHLVERIGVLELVNDSLRLVPPDRLARMTIIRDPSLQEVGALSLPRTALAQVMQNLVLNACEAVRPGERGMIRIRCALEQWGGRQVLAMAFQDDGTGIPPELMPRLFSKGFSTKSSETNSGLGLHWCANVLQAMEGSLRAESDGTDRGATFHLKLPLA